MSWIRIGLLLVIIGGLTALCLRSELFHFFLDKERLLLFLRSLGPWGFVGFVCLQAAQVIIAPIPGDVTGLLGGYLYGLLPGIILSTVGLTLGSLVAFVLSRSFGRPFVLKFVPEPAVKKFDYLVNRKSAFLIFFLFLIPCFPKDYFCYILGLGRVSMGEFLLLGGAGRLFGTILLTMGGNCIRLHQYTRLSILIAVALISITLVIVRREQLEKVLRLYNDQGRRG